MAFGGSLTDIALLIAVNVIFLSNYFFIRTLRCVVDDTDFQNDNTILNKMHRSFVENPLVAGVGGFVKSFNRAKENGISRKRGKFVDVAYAFLFGHLRMAPCIEKRFPGWKPIPFKMGLVSSSLTLLLATALLSDHAITGKFTHAKGSGFCSTKDAEAKLVTFDDHIRSSNVTNILMGERQYHETKKYRNSLLKDATRYGIESESSCVQFPSAMNWNNVQVSNNFFTKEAYEVDPTRTMKYGPNFFPGYCRAAKDYSRTFGCTLPKRICLDDWGFNWFCKTVTVSVPCSPTWQGEIDEELQADEVAFKSEASAEDLDHLQQDSVKAVETILRQIDLAGTVYSFYIVLALFFPTPIIIYKPNRYIALKKSLFGVGKNTFIVVALIIYWGYEHITTLFNLPEVRIFFTNFLTDPCFLDSDFIGNRTKIVRDVCTKLIDVENKVGTAKFEITQLIADVTQFDEQCGCPYPGRYLNSSYLMEDSNVLGFEKNWSIKMFVDKSDVLLLKPKDQFQFLGNETICVDQAYARDQIMLAEDTGLSWWQLWITSGLLAGLVIKFFISNLGISLVKLADPFYSCEGKYQSPPEDLKYTSSDDEEGDTQSFLYVNREITEIKTASLRAIAFRGTIFWGVLTELCLVSLIMSSAPNINELNMLDIIIASSILSVCIIGPIGCYIFSKYASSAVENETKQPQPIDKMKDTIKDMVGEMLPSRKKKTETTFDKMKGAASSVTSSVSTHSPKNKKNTVADTMFETASNIISNISSFEDK